MAQIPFGRHRRKLGEMLLAESLITQDQLNRALEIQRATREPLGRVLLNMGVVDQEHVARFISEQIGSEFVRLVGLPLPEDLQQLLPVSDAARLQAIPISQENGTLTVAMVDPFDVIAVDEIRRRTGLGVVVAVTTLSDFQYALNQYPKGEDPMQALIRDLPEREVAEERKSLEQVRREASEQPVVRLVNQLIEEAVRQRATDIHIEPQGRHVRVRY
ncbi:MAG: GspE/PulE family protein, partial [bacterium]